MNRENLRYLAHELRADPDSYDQTRYRHPCGTAACVAGKAQMICKGAFEVESVEEDAARWLGLRMREDSHWLFTDLPSLAWPQAYAERYDAAYDEVARAFVCADLLDAIADGLVKA